MSYIFFDSRPENSVSNYVTQKYVLDTYTHKIFKE